MRLRHFAFAALAALLLVGCTAPTSTPEAPSAAPAPAAPLAAERLAEPPVAAPPAATLPTAETAPRSDASNPSRSCKTDSDCAVKNVGNCCGAFPSCVNKDAKTDPPAVQAQCAKAGMASVCGFQEVSGCQCVQGECQNITSGAVVM
ncbi:MAG: hypothetical protein J0M09_07645 [Xanthomonadales bacterium]|nr:hypothetical protein [Xanthomonadales bacterium]